MEIHVQFPEEKEADGDGRQYHEVAPGGDGRPRWWQQDAPVVRTVLRCATAVGTTLIVAYAQHQLVRELASAYLTARGCGPV